MLRCQRELIGVVLSAVGVLLSFQSWNFFYLAFIALIPLWWVAKRCNNRQLFIHGFVWGIIFFYGLLWWLNFVTWPGAILLCCYLSLYPAVFMVALKFARSLPLWKGILFAASVWGVLEYVRSVLFTGFGWGALAHSQVSNLYFIQIVDILGVHGVSWVMVVINLILAGVVFHRRWVMLIGLGVIVGIMWGYGYWTVKTYDQKQHEYVRVGVIQPNIPQAIKWVDSYKSAIIDKHLALHGLIAQQEPSLIIWPETSMPGVIGDNVLLMEKITQEVKALGIPTMLGAIVQQDKQYFNAAFLIDSQGNLAQRYDKIHLVPFGEYIPLRPLLGWINHFVGMEDFSSGNTSTIFPINGQGHFGVLICFEDTLSYLWQALVKNDAELVVNMTNDAWFHDTKAPYVHLQTAMINSIMYKRALVRSANTGVSGFIDPLGRVIKLLDNGLGKHNFMAGISDAYVPLNQQVTVMAKVGNVFVFMQILIILLLVIANRKEGYVQKNITH